MSSDLIASPLLSVKRAIPPLRAGAVSRDRLEGRLNRSTAKLAAVVAPAGWGKTTLLSRWAARAAQQTPIAWVSLDESDDEPVRFWSYVLTALRSTSPEITAAPLEALTASAADPTALALPMLINELAATPTPHVLVLDDYHAITDRRVHESLEFLLSYLPPANQVVIASRWDPPLPLARMRARGELVELRASDLRFSVDEASAMVSAVSEVELDPAAASALWERTEGWPAGLQLAALTLRGAEHPAAAAARVRGDDRHLFDYFTSEVLPSLAPRQRELLNRTAPLERLSGSLCDAVLVTHGSAEVLAEIERADLFLVALDADREWYRCHRLLRDALQRGAEVLPDAGMEEVLVRAARWFSDHGQIDEAVRHLLRAGDDAAAAAALQTHDAWFLDRGWATTLLALGDRLAQSVIEPQLALSLCYAAQLSGGRERVYHWLDLCDQRIDEDTVVVGWRSARAAAVMMRGVVESAGSDTALAVTLCERAVAWEADAGAQRQPTALAALGSVLVLDGRYSEAVPILTESLALDRSYWSRGLDLQLAGLLALSLLQLNRGEQLDRLLSVSAPTAAAAEQNFGDAAAPLVATLRLVEARRCFLLGELKTARSGLQHGIRLAEASARPLSLVIGLLFLADLELAEGDRGRARAALVRAREVVDTEPMAPFVRKWLDESDARIGRVAVRNASRAGVLLDELTDREMSILRMLPGSASQREIGAALFLSINTVKAYNKSLYRKLGAGSRQEAVSTARRFGLI